MQVGQTTEPHSGVAAQLRHARVLPSFVLRVRLQVFETSIGVVEPDELLAWSGASLPSKFTGDEIRANFVRRRRPTFNDLWSSEIRIQAPADWSTLVSGEDRLLLKPLLATEEARARFPLLTLRQVKESMHLPVAAVLAVLARLEALHWIPKANARRIRPPSSTARLQVTEDLRQLLVVCSNAGWVRSLNRNDLRFPAQSEQPIYEWLELMSACSTMSADQHDLCEQLIAANRGTWADELASIASSAFVAARKGPSSETTRTRWREFFTARYGGIAGQTLQEVGENFGVTRERIRQVCEHMVDAIRGQPCAMPALQKVLSSAARIMPLPIPDADRELSRILGPGHGLEAALAFARDAGVKAAIQLSESKARTSEGYTAVSVVESVGESSEWINEALSQARRDVVFVGCSSITRIAGIIALSHGIARDRETWLSILAAAPGFRLLDRESGWFVLADSESSAAATRVKKLMSVVQGPVPLDTIASALMTDDRWLYRDGGRALSLPPLHILVPMMAGWSWLSANAHNIFSSKLPLDPEVLLSKTELCALAALRDTGGIGTRNEILARAVPESGASVMAVTVTLSSSPAFYHLEHSIYAIRGKALKPKALEAVHRRRAAEMNREMVPTPINAGAPVRIWMTQSGSVVPVNQRVVYLPAAYKHLVTGHYGHKAEIHRPIRVKGNGQIFGLAAAAERVGVRPSQRFEIEVDLSARTYEITTQTP